MSQYSTIVTRRDNRGKEIKTGVVPTYSLESAIAAIIVRFEVRGAGDVTIMEELGMASVQLADGGSLTAVRTRRLA